jgi:hypothetical protein
MLRRAAVTGSGVRPTGRRRSAQLVPGPGWRLNFEYAVGKGIACEEGLISPRKQPEPWMRGPLAGIDPLVAPLFYSFTMARQDLAEFTEGLTPDQIWARPFGLNPVGREIRHIGGSVDRLVTYLEGRELSEAQLAELKAEFEPGASRADLLAALDAQLARAEQVLRSIDPKTFAEPRSVGRKKLPTTVIGLIVHIAEHTQRHVGQAVSAAKLARAVAGKPAGER